MTDEELKHYLDQGAPTLTGDVPRYPYWEWRLVLPGWHWVETIHVITIPNNTGSGGTHAAS